MIAAAEGSPVNILEPCESFLMSGCLPLPSPKSVSDCGLITLRKLSSWLGRYPVSVLLSNGCNCGYAAKRASEEFSAVMLHFAVRWPSNGSDTTLVR